MSASPLHDRGVISRYRERLPVPAGGRIVSLNEGSTPLVHCPRLSERAGRDVFVKYEGLNPTGSFKDRGMTMAISMAATAGRRAVICASTGNTSASAAAYAARAGMDCLVLLPAGKIAAGKLAQAFVYGAKVVAIDGNFDDALRLVRELGATGEFEIVNSINPYRIEGQKTAAFEIVDELGDAPAVHILPVGNAGNITAYWKGYREDQAAGRAATLPHMVGFQAAGAAPVYYDRIIANPETVATAIRIGNPASWDEARAAIRDSGGSTGIVTDTEILDAQAWLAAREGIFVEPASAAPVAGLFQCLDPQSPARPDCPVRNAPEGAPFVLTVTGHGLKDTAAPLAHRAFAPIEAAATPDAVLRALDSHR